jgi:hypothetical protein
MHIIDFCVRLPLGRRYSFVGCTDNPLSPFRPGEPNMNAANDLVDNLAGHLAEPALEMLTAAGIQSVSVDMEVAVWQTLKEALRHIMARDISRRTDLMRKRNAGFTGNAGELAGSFARRQ